MGSSRRKTVYPYRLAWPAGRPRATLAVPVFMVDASNKGENNMKVLTSTTIGQRPSERDFNFTVEGELVMQGSECCNGDSCGCNRSVVGVKSRKGTTTFQVSERPELNVTSLAKIYREALLAAGFESTTKADTMQMAKLAASVAKTFNTGDVLTIKNGLVVRRQLEGKEIN